MIEVSSQNLFFWNSTRFPFAVPVSNRFYHSLFSSERQRDGSPAVTAHSAREAEGLSVSKAEDDDEATGAVASVEDQALTIFLQGVEDEEEGKLYEAIVKYKKVRRRNRFFV